MIWNEKIETMSLENLKNLQSERLATLCDYLYSNNPVYRARFDKEGIAPASIRSIDDIVKLPFTTKDDMRDHYPYGLFTGPIEDIREIHVSSGTTGNPTLTGYSKEDLALWSEVMARTLACAGAVPRDMIQIAYGYGLFTGGLGFHYGALEMGLKIIPCSSGMTARQLKIMQDLKPRILACTPSYSLFMAEEAREAGLDTRKCGSWEIGIFGAEPWSEAMRGEIEKTWNMLATDVYGMSEIIGPGVAQECHLKCGLHIYSDVFYPEIINPKTNQPVKPGEEGELVVTTFTKKSIPLLRYRTRDIVSMNLAPCACGRTSPRISKIKGRTDDMIIVRGINVFPSQVEHVLVGIEGTLPVYQLVVDRKSNLDELEVHVEVDQKIFSDEIKTLRAMEDLIKRKIEDVLGVGVRVKLLEPKSIERSVGKAVRVVDKRKM